MRNTAIPILLTFLSLLIFTIGLQAQDPPPNDANSSSLGGSATAASKLSDIPVNIYTGTPTISIPLYNYSHHNGLNLAISLQYADAGGVKVDETPTPAGLGWYLQAGGIITRTVRGLPDDISSNGFMYASAIPADFRPNGYKYYHDSLDAQQDVFQYNINGRTGKFYIGKNKQIVTVPLSKLRISYITSGGLNTPIYYFIIIFEDGVKYVFSNDQVQSFSNPDYKSGYNGTSYISAWYLTQMISPLGTDTIKFTYHYTAETGSVTTGPQTVFVRNSDNFVYRHFTPTVSQTNTTVKIDSILFPDKKNIKFLYSRTPTLYDGKDSTLWKMKVSDSIFRFGYLFSYSGRGYLDSLQYFTKSRAQPPYFFSYSGGHILPAMGSTGDTLGNKRDYWGYYNQTYNGDNSIPTLTGIYSGANRTPQSFYGKYGQLYTITDPAGGVTYYNFEPNDVNQYTTTTQSISFNANGNTQTSVAVSQGSGTSNTFMLALDNSFSRIGTPPFSGTCNIACSITSTDGLTTYATGNVNLFQLFYMGQLGFTFNVPNGNYLFKTSLVSCTTTPGSLSIPINVTWQNQSLIGSAGVVGGFRIQSIWHLDFSSAHAIDTIKTYAYKTSDGKSSGFMGSIPRYDYPYQETVINGSTTTTNYTAITSDPVNDLDYTQGNPVGYSRVVVYKGTPTHNLGSTIYEYTNLQDLNTVIAPPSFPYAPITEPDWAVGLPKRVSIYDSLGNLIEVKRDTFSITTQLDTTSDFTSLKLGKTSVTFNGDPNLVATPYTEYYSGQTYNVQTGRADLTSSIDSLFHPDGSLQVTYRTAQYDTNYNVTKTVSPYDASRGLSLEKRFYYPYNYTFSSGPIKKLKDSSIINPIISTENWITGDANPRIVGAQITDYQQLSSGHVKPLTLYALQSNAPIPQSTIGAFNPGSLVRNASYLVPQASFPTYDAVGNLLEVKNSQSGQSSSTIMDYFNQYPIAKVSNAAYSDIAYTSFESDGSGNWTIPGTARNSTAALTGKYCYDLSQGSISKSGLSSLTSYIVSVWAGSGAAVLVNGTLQSTSIAQQNGWNLFTTTITGVTTVTISGTGLIDELRLHPKDAHMATTSFEPMIGATSVCDPNNTVIYYNYDSMNRVSAIRDKDMNVLNKYGYDTVTLSIKTTPTWIGRGYYCESSFNERLDSVLVDINPLSDSIGVTKLVYLRNDCNACPLTCGGQGYKWLNCVCEAGSRVNSSSVQVKINGVFKWQCTYHYSFSDCSVSQNYVEIDNTSCTVFNGCP